jgi:hypothetical protein
MSTCRMCGADPCINPTFCTACRRADAKLADERRAGPQRESAGVLRARRLLDDSASFNGSWHELNDPRSRPTPQVTIEAIMYCVHERGLAALKEPANVERLVRCDAVAKVRIDKRIEKLMKGKSR